MGHDPRRFLLPLALPILLLSAACGPGATTSRGEHRAESGSPEILWDDWGVPHVFAATDADLFYAFGWATAHNHADLLLRLYGQARGRAAEYWGESYLDGDRYVWTMGVPGRATEWLGQQDDEIRGFLEAYVSGINDYAATHPEAIADDAEIVLPVTAEDALAHTQRILHFTFVSNPGEIRGARRSLEAAGSNAWAVGPPMSATSKSLLVANPHLPWADLFTWFESQLIGPEVDVYGATLVGAPFLTIAFNDALGWTHTVNTHDGRDLFTLELDGDGYRYDGEVRPFEREEVTLKVLQEDKSLREETLEVRRSIHGPVVAINGGQAVSLAVVGLEASEIFRQYWDMSRADNLADWMEAIRRIQMPMFTFMYADRDGNILHHFGGETPVRPQGDWSTWSRPVPGDTSDWAWSGTHEFDDLPTVLNPESGWLQNANDPPWTTTFPEPLDPTAFPSYMAPQFMHFRAQRSARMLAEETDGLTFDEAITLKQSTRLELADRILDDLQAAVEESGNSLASEPMEVLAAWDRQTETTSRGAVLFARFEQEMRDRGLGLIPPWNEAGFAPHGVPTIHAQPPTAWETVTPRWKHWSRRRPTFANVMAPSTSPGETSTGYAATATTTPPTEVPEPWGSSGSSTMTGTATAGTPLRATRMWPSSSSTKRPTRRFSSPMATPLSRTLRTPATNSVCSPRSNFARRGELGTRSRRTWRNERLSFGIDREPRGILATYSRAASSLIWRWVWTWTPANGSRAATTIAAATVLASRARYFSNGPRIRNRVSFADTIPTLSIGRESGRSPNKRLGRKIRTDSKPAPATACSASPLTER